MPTLNAFVSTAEAMQSVKAALAKASAGPKKNAALIHLRAAETAQAAHQEGDCLMALSAATAALTRKG